MLEIRRPFANVLTTCVLLGALTGCEPPPEEQPSTPGAPQVLVDPETGAQYELQQGRPMSLPANGEIEAHTSALVSEGTDWSGRVRIQIVTCVTTSPQPHPSLACAVDPSFVVVGGGARTIYGTYPGALLTETRPLDSTLRHWVASSKDHVENSPHYLEVYAIGMRLEGVKRDDLLAKMQLNAVTSDKAAHPFAEAMTSEGFLMIGGGAKVNWSGAGNLLTRSSPRGETADERSWLVGSKDHRRDSQSTITAYVIGIRPNVPGWGTLEIATRFGSGYFFSRQVGNVLKSADTGWVVSCPGALSDWFPGNGRLLTGIVPGLASATALDKDHLVPDDGTLLSYVRQVRRKK